MMRLTMLIAVTSALAGCGDVHGSTQVATSRSPTPDGTPTSTLRVASDEDITWARRNLRAEPGYEQFDLAIDWVMNAGPAAAPLLDDLLPLLELNTVKEDPGCVAGVKAICAIGPKAARAVPALARVALRQEIGDGERILTLCPKTAEFEIVKIGDAAFPYLDVPEYSGLLGSLAFGRAQELLTRLRTGGPDMEAAAVIMATIEYLESGVREALIEGHRAGHVSDAIFLRAIQELRDVSLSSVTIPLKEFEPIVARIAAKSKDPNARRNAARMLKLFPHYPPGVGGPRVESLRLPPDERRQAAPTATPAVAKPKPSPAASGAP